MDRITPEMSLKAFEVLNIIPIKGGWADIIVGEDINICCACGLTTIALSEGVEFNSIHGSINPEDLVLDFLFNCGLDNDYMNGFVKGFDGYGMGRKDSYSYAGHFKRGIDDGMASWNAVRHLGYGYKEDLND